MSSRAFFDRSHDMASDRCDLPKCALALSWHLRLSAPKRESVRRTHVLICCSIAETCASTFFSVCKIASVPLSASVISCSAADSPSSRTLTT